MKENGSMLSQLNPSWKLIIHLLVMILLMTIADPITTLSFWLFSILIGIFAGGWTFAYIFRRILPYTIFFVFIFWMLAAFGKGEHTIWQWAWFHVTEESVKNGLTIALRMLSFVTYGLLFTSTTDLTKFVMSLIHQLRLSPKWAYGLLAGFRFIPLFQSELRQMKAAHKIRGFKQKGKKDAFVRFTLPLFTQGIRKAERIAIAMEARSFTGERDRTYYHKTQISRNDMAYSVVLFAFITAILVASSSYGSLTWTWALHEG